MNTIEEIRHANLLLILQELGNAPGGERGAIQVLATRMGRQHSQISQLKTRAVHSKTGKPRNIGPSVARAIEEASGKERGWLDVAHQADEDLNAKLARFVDEAVARRLAAATPRTGAPDGEQEVPRGPADNQPPTAPGARPALRNVNPPNQLWGAGPLAPTLRDPPLRGGPRTKKPTKP